MVVVGGQGLKDYNGLARTHHDTFFYCRKSRDFQGGKEKAGKNWGILGKKAGIIRGSKEKVRKNWRFSGGKPGGKQGESRDYQGKARESRDYQGKARESRGKQGKAGIITGFSLSHSFLSYP